MAHRGSRSSRNDLERRLDSPTCRPDAETDRNKSWLPHGCNVVCGANFDNHTGVTPCKTHEILLGRDDEDLIGCIPCPAAPLVCRSMRTHGRPFLQELRKTPTWKTWYQHFERLQMPQPRRVDDIWYIRGNRMAVPLRRIGPEVMRDTS